jgi:uncharacterized protein YkwD
MNNYDQSDVLYMKENTSLDTNNIPSENEKINPGVTKFNRPEVGISVFIGKQVDDLIASIGNPVRRDPTPFGYEWLIFNENDKEYMQVGVKNGKIVTIYAIGENIDISPFRIGQPVEDIFSKVLIETGVNFVFEGTSYRFEMSEDDINTRPLVKMGDLYVQLQIDKFTGELSSVRFLSAETLVRLRPYELVYRGTLLENEPIFEEAWLEIEQGSEKQIFDITNLLRKRYSLTPLEWDEPTAEVAYLHSRDMFETGTFSHTSKRFGELSDRLKTANIEYKSAGENIAANYMDAPAVMEGWLNSKGHRETLLEENYTHIGIGVYRKHYTQNYIQKPEQSY